MNNSISERSPGSRWYQFCEAVACRLPFWLYEGMLTKEQMAKFKKQLLVTKSELESETSELEKTPDFGSDVDSFEEETNEADALGTNLSIEQSVKDHYHNVVRALAKMDDGTFGICDRCGKAIGLDLLTLEPASRLCQACKLTLRT